MSGRVTGRTRVVLRVIPPSGQEAASFLARSPKFSAKDDGSLIKEKAEGLTVCIGT